MNLITLLAPMFKVIIYLTLEKFTKNYTYTPRGVPHTFLAVFPRMSPCPIRGHNDLGAL